MLNAAVCADVQFDIRLGAWIGADISPEVVDAIQVDEMDGQQTILPNFGHDPNCVAMAPLA